MLYISAHIERDAAPTEAVRELAGYGFERIELAGPADWNAFDEEGLADLAEDNDLSLILHNDFPPQMEDFVPNLATEDEEEQTRLVRLLDEALRLSQTLRARVYSLQAGFAWELSPEADAGPALLAPIYDARENMAEAVSNLAKRLPKNFVLAVSNGTPQPDGSPLSLMASPEQILEFLEMAGDVPELGLFLDIPALERASGLLGFGLLDALDDVASRYVDKIAKIRLAIPAADARPTPGLTNFMRAILPDIPTAPVVLDWRGISLRDLPDQVEAFRKAFFV